ncbi:hypothetical protein [Antarctobacter jejuensis]|uniref:hypothetical protein n=1 Tax=Antarctobacter jejuensis TaxID=1439938 RepID=UPI003FD0508F
MILHSNLFARRHAGQPPTAPQGGGFAPTLGRGLPFALHGTHATRLCEFDLLEACQ